MPTSLRMGVCFRKLVWLGIGVMLAAVHALSPRLLAQSEPSALPALKADETLRPAIAEGLRVHALRDTRDTSLVQLMIQVDRPPVGMAFDLSLGSDSMPGVPSDRARIVGQVAWSNQIRWWAFDIDVPAGYSSLDVVFTPSATAAAKLKRRNPDELKELDSIWTGKPISIHVNISTQALGGMITTPPPKIEEAREDQIEMLAGDDLVIQQVKRGGDLAQARQQLRRQVQENLQDAAAWYNLGCLTVASPDWPQALEYFAKAKKISADPALAKKAQSQLRRIGGYLAYEASEEITAMYGLGVMYQRGWGPSIDRQEAKKWFRNAANAGHAEAMIQLAVMYDQDLATGGKTPKAEAWYRQQVREMYRQAADLGNEEAKKWIATHE